MVDDQSILKIERLRDDLASFKADLRSRYTPKAQVHASGIKQEAARLAETWLVDVLGRRGLVALMPETYVADLNVRFTRLLTFSEHATLRSSYETEINAILKEFTTQLIVPLKRHRTSFAEDLKAHPSDTGTVNTGGRSAFVPTAFLGHSFDESDIPVVKVVTDTLIAVGISVVTGQRPRAERISDKVKKLIDGQYLFVGLFTRGDKLAAKAAWMTSPWIIDEKAYAFGKGKPLVLLVERGVESIGGLQGDWEYIKFSRDSLHKLVVDLISVFSVVPQGLA